MEFVDVINEIHDLHYDLQRWVQGNIFDYSRIQRRQAKDLTHIGTGGSLVIASQFNENYKSFHGKHETIKIDAEIVRTKRIDKKNILVIFKAITDFGTEKYCRMTTAVFRYNSSLPNKCEWCHVHETATEIMET